MNAYCNECMNAQQVDRSKRSSLPRESVSRIELYFSIIHNPPSTVHNPYIVIEYGVTYSIIGAVESLFEVQVASIPLVGVVVHQPQESKGPSPFLRPFDKRLALPR